MTLLPGKNPLSLPASTTAVASLRIPHGTAPTSPVDGDIWTTSSSIFARINGATKDLTAGGGGSAFDAITTSSGAATNATLWGDVTTGAITIGGAQTSGGLTLGNASQSGSINLLGYLVNIERSSNQPTVQIKANAASGYLPAFMRFNRVGAGDTTTPTGSAIGELRFDGKDSGGSYTQFAAMSVSIGTIAAGGAPTDLTFATSKGAAGMANALTLGSDQRATFFGTIYPATGTTSLSPLNFASGTLKTTPAAGDLEFDGDAMLLTGTNQGRMIVNGSAQYRLNTGASAIAAGTDFFPSKRPFMEQGRAYRFEFWLHFTKNTAGTVTFQIKNSAAVNFSRLTAFMVITPTGVVLPALANFSSVTVNAGATLTFPASPSLTAGSTYIAYVWGFGFASSDTRLSIAPSAYSAGTITTLAGSFQTMQDFGKNNQDYGDLG